MTQTDKQKLLAEIEKLFMYWHRDLDGRMLLRKDDVLEIIRKLPEPQVRYIAVEIFDTEIRYDGRQVFCGNVKNKSQAEIDAIINKAKAAALQTPKEQPVQVYNRKLSNIIEEHLQASYSGAGVHPEEMLKAIRPYLRTEQTANLEKVREALEVIVSEDKGNHTWGMTKGGMMAKYALTIITELQAEQPVNQRLVEAINSMNQNNQALIKKCKQLEAENESLKELLKSEKVPNLIRDISRENHIGDITKMLDSPEMMEVVAKTLYCENHWDDGAYIEWENLESDNIFIETYKSHAKAALTAIKERLGV